MRQYILKRILLFIPTFFVITLLSFIILVNAPGDPVERMMTTMQGGDDTGQPSAAQVDQQAFWTKRLGLNLPVFYFSIHSLDEPDTLYRIADKLHRKVLTELTSTYGHWPLVAAYWK